MPFDFRHLMTPLMPLLWLPLVFAVTLLVLWVLRRHRPGGSAALTSSGGVRVVSQTVLSFQQRLVTIEVGEGHDRCWLVLGVTAQQISVLHRLIPPADEDGAARREPALPSIAGTSFGYLLTQWRRGPQGPAVRRHAQ